MIEVDLEEPRHLILVADGVGIRTVLKMEHEDGTDLLRQLQEYYGRKEYGKNPNEFEAPTRRGLFQRLFGRKGNRA